MQPLIETIYSGTIEPTPWNSFLTNLREFYGADATTLILEMPESTNAGLLFSANVDAAYERKYIAKFPHALFSDLPINKAATMDEVIDRKQLVDTDFYKELLKPANTEYILGINVPFVHDQVAFLRISRRREQGQFSPADKCLLETLASHLEQALPIFFRMHQLASEREMFGDALDQLHIGAILLDRHGRYLHANGKGREALDAGRGLALRDGMVVAARPDQARRLTELVRDAVAAYAQRDHAYCGMLTLRTNNEEERIQVLLRPSARPITLEESQTPAISLFISSPHAPHIPSAEAIRELFGLTRTEGMIVAELLVGMTPKEIAHKLDSSLGTVRTHMKSIFLKAGVRRQADLLTAILRSVAPLA